MQIAVRSPNASFVSVGLFFLLFCFLLHLSACARHNYRDEPVRIYRGYEGQFLSKEQHVQVWWDKDLGEIVSINNRYIYGDHTQEKQKYHYVGAQLLPGEYSFEYSVGCHKCAPALIRLEAHLVAGRTYEFRLDYQYKAYNANDYAARLVDVSSGDIVAGRPAAVLKWSWNDWEKALQEMKHSATSQQKAIELLSEPEPFVGRPTDNTPVYIVCPDSYSGISHWRVMNSSGDTEGCGLLFLQFSDADQLVDYIFLEVPFHDCYKNPFTIWDWKTWHSIQRSCRKRIKSIAFAEYFAITGSPYDAYLQIEDGLRYRHKEVMLQQSRLLLDKYPEIIRSANTHFTKKGFEQSVATYGDHAEQIERKRLSVFHQFAKPEDYEVAKREFLMFFETTTLQ
jgi:hypothetical protein